jgi:acetyl-CoA carboxylase carboxyl transferase subunit alpha
VPKTNLSEIEELENTIKELKNLNKDNMIDVSSELKELTDKLEKLTKKANNQLTAWDRVSIARNPKRPTALDYIDIIFDEFVELHGDRCFKDDEAMVCGLANIGKQNYTIIAEQKGRNTKENIKRNFGMPNPESYRKAIRLMKQAEKFGRPIVTFIDTKGAYPGIGAEERGQGEAIAKSMMEMANLKTPIICIVIGEGSSGGALAIGVGDEIIMLENAVYSILSPEGYASILWKDGSRVKEAADKMKMTAQDLKKFNVIDKIIAEPYGGAQNDIEMVAENLKKEIISNTKKLKKLELDELVQKRYEKFRNMGEYIH